MTDPILPAWLLEVLPEVLEPSRISMAGEVIRLSRPDGTVEDFATLEDLEPAVRGLDFTIADEVYHHFGQEPRSLGLFFPSKNRGFSSLLLSLTDEDRLGLLTSAYEESLRAYIRYQADPTSFYNAYSFVGSHPAFWHRHRELSDKFPWDWETSGHCNRVSQYVMRVEPDDDADPEAIAQGYVIALETGSHVPYDDPHGGPTAYTSHFHDYRLDAYGLSFEAAYVQLAALVDKFFYPDGSEKPGVEHDKPAWVIELEARIEEVERLREEEEE